MGSSHISSIYYPNHLFLGKHEGFHGKHYLSFPPHKSTSCTSNSSPVNWEQQSLPSCFIGFQWKLQDTMYIYALLNSKALYKWVVYNSLVFAKIIISSYLPKNAFSSFLFCHSYFLTKVSNSKYRIVSLKSTVRGSLNCSGRGRVNRQTDAKIYCCII